MIEVCKKIQTIIFTNTSIVNKFTLNMVICSWTCKNPLGHLICVQNEDKSRWQMVGLVHLPLSTPLCIHSTQFKYVPKSILQLAKLWLLHPKMPRNSCSSTLSGINFTVPKAYSTK